MGKKPPVRLPHPRNIYREKPNIKELALQYPEFREFAIQTLDGRVTMNFKDKKAVCALTKVLLKKDFQLTVDIPADRLVPTVPLRLNYLLWIEDLLEVLSSHLKSSSEVYGIDIGTGASCIYALLAARKNGYHMLATEVDEISFEYASRNVASNNLENLVKVKKVSDNTFISGVLDLDIEYDFCMCNPPFFSALDKRVSGGSNDNDNDNDNDTTDEVGMIKTKDRTSHRLPPKSAPTGSLVELAAPGGEVAFIENIINDSAQLKNKIRIYTSMVGHKSNVDKLIAKLVKSDGLGLRMENVTTTSFHQGNVTRWAIAWTFNDTIKFPSAECDKLLQQNKKLIKPPVQHTFENIKVEEAVVHLRFLLDRIQVIKKVVDKRSTEYALEIMSYEATWKNQRKRRREEKRRINEIKRIKNESILDKSTGENSAENDHLLCPEKASSSNKSDSQSNTSTDNSVELENEPNQYTNTSLSLDFQNSDKILPDSRVISNCSSSSNGSILSNAERPLILKALLLLKQCVENKKNVVLQMSSIGGVDGWNAVHQVLTYLKNHWNRNDL